MHKCDIDNINHTKNNPHTKPVLYPYGTIDNNLFISEQHISYDSTDVTFGYEGYFKSECPNMWTYCNL